MSGRAITPEEAGAMLSEAIEHNDDDPAMRPLLEALEKLADAAGAPLPTTPWERDALVESAKRKLMKADNPPGPYPVECEHGYDVCPICDADVFRANRERDR